MSEAIRQPPTDRYRCDPPTYSVTEHNGRFQVDAKQWVRRESGWDLDAWAEAGPFDTEEAARAAMERMK